MISKVRERLAIYKQATQMFNVERFNLRQLSELEVRNQLHIKDSKKFAATGNLNDSEDIHWAWRKIRENTKMSAKESLRLYKLKQHTPCFDEDVHGF